MARYPQNQHPRVESECDSSYFSCSTAHSSATQPAPRPTNRRRRVLRPTRTRTRHRGNSINSDRRHVVYRVVSSNQTTQQKQHVRREDTSHLSMRSYHNYMLFINENANLKKRSTVVCRLCVAVLCKKKTTKKTKKKQKRGGRWMSSLGLGTEHWASKNTIAVSVFFRRPLCN